MTPAELFGAILDGDGEPVLRDDRGRARALPVDVWLGRAGAVDERVLDHARGPVLDVGCGPGRQSTRSRAAACSGSASTSRRWPPRWRAGKARPC
jgi:hypothetical protein